MALEVLNVASTSDSNTDCPTNPKLKTNLGASSNRHFTVIHPDSSEDITYSEILGTMPGSSDLFTEWENLENTEGFRIKCYDSSSDSGIQLDNIDLDYYNFVLIYSDNENMHHFAKITETTSQDADGDAFDFEPRLGHEIPKGTKFMLFKTTATIASTNALAFSAGIKDNLRNELVCARPLFYFVNSSLDKNNQLNHNVKYFAQNNTASSGSSVAVNNLKVTFLTHPDFGKRIIDYGPYSLEIDLVDKMRDNDVAVSPVLQESSVSLGGDYTDYNDVFYNARRQTSDDISGSLDLTGPTRYLHYGFSPDQCNHIPTVIDLVVDDSIGGRSGIANAKMIDNARILPKKISEDDPLRIRHYVHNGAVMDWFELKAELDTHSGSRTYTLLTDYADITDILSVGDEVKINDRICFVDSISSSSITLEEFSRLETESSLTNTTALTNLEGYTIYRRVFSAQNNTLLTTFSMLDSIDAGVREYDLYVKFLGTSYKFIYASVSLCNADNQTLTLSFDLDAYSSTPLEYIDGGYQIFIERFDGVVEDKETFKENGQTFMKIEGRDNLRKLLSPIVNKNYLFSEDMIYTTKSFHNSITALVDSSDSAVTVTMTADSKGDASSNFYTSPSATIATTISEGDILYASFGADGDTLAFLGVATINGSYVNLVDWPKIWGTTMYLYKATEKNYVLNKALSANNNLSVPLSSLSGSSEKGFIFTGGSTLNSDGTENTLLAGTGKNVDDLGYSIIHPSSIGIDAPFQCKLDATDFDTVNSLMDFTILDFQEEEDFTLLEIAPYLPLSLGRTDINWANTETITLADVGDTTEATTDSVYLNVPASLSSTNHFARGEPVYVDGSFLGHCLDHGVYYHSGSSSYKGLILLDRKVTVSSGATVQHQNDSNYTYSLNLLNGAHLHTNKVIGVLSPFVPDDYTDNNLSYLNHSMVTTASNARWSYAAFYGMPVFRTTNIEKGNFNIRDTSKPIYMDTSGNEQDLTYYGKVRSKIKYYADSYRITQAKSGNTYFTTLFNTAIPLPIERGGFEPVRGSRFFDTVANESGFTFTAGHATGDSADYGYPYWVKALYEQKDPKAARMVLFINGDREPYSGKRKDSLVYNNRDLTKYSALLLKEPKDQASSVENSISLTSTSRISNVDSDYESVSIIEASKQINQLHQFGLMRLTECVYDWHFNQIDPENMIDTNESLIQPRYYSEIIFDSGVTGTLADSTSVTLSASGDDLFKAGDQVYNNNGKFVGIVSSVSGTTLTLTSKPWKNSNIGGYLNSGNLFIMRERITGTHKGRAGKDSFRLNGDIHMLKAAIKNNYYSNDSGSWFKTFYGQGIDDTTTYDPEIIYPIDFGENFYYYDTISVTRTAGSPDITTTDNIAHLKVGDFIYNSTSAGDAQVPFNNLHTFLTITAINLSTGTITLSQNVISTGSAGSGSGHATIWREGGQFEPSNPIRALRETLNQDDVTNPDITEKTQFLRYNAMGVILDTYGIEESTEAYVGVCSAPSDNMQVILSSDENDEDRVYENATDSNSARRISIPSISTTQRYHEYSSIERDSGDAITDTEATGAFLGFKFRLSIDSTIKATQTTSNVGDRDVYHYKIITANEQSSNYFLNLINTLSGCYLVSEKGTNYATTDSAKEDTPSSKEELLPDKISYVLQHQIDDTQSSITHYITTDVILVNDYYRIMQPNHTCMYDFSPETIELNMLSSKYTKMARENKMYDNPNSWNVRGASALYNYEDGTNAAGAREAILSMYLTIDLNDRTGYSSPIFRGTTTDLQSDTYYIPNQKTTMAISDGENSYKTSVQLVGASVTPRIYLGETKEMLGVVSITEPFNIKVPKNVNTSAKRLLIGAGLTIGAESGDIINSLLESNNIEFDQTNPSNELYLSPNIQGLSLYDAINSVTNKINHTLVKEKGIFAIRPGDDANNYTNITLSDYGDYQIYDFKKSSTIFDEYNEIIVYGATTKSTRKNIKSIQKKGRKTLEVFEKDLFSQEDTDRRAAELYLIHNKLNEKLTIEVGHTGISQIKPGDIISVEIRRENLPRDEYLVLSIRHLLTGNMVLELGRYSKQLEDRFAELIISNRRTNAALREQKFNENTIDFTLLETLKVKPLRLLIKKTESSGSVFGFSTTFSPSTIFNSVTGSETVLVEEDF